jgi:hypothetical protein
MEEAAEEELIEEALLEAVEEELIEEALSENAAEGSTDDGAGNEEVGGRTMIRPWRAILSLRGDHHDL